MVDQRPDESELQAARQWDAIHQHPEAYKYYDLQDHYEAMGRVVTYFRENNVGRVLDVGCGQGDNMAYLAQEGFVVAGIDAAPTAVQATTTRTKGVLEVKQAFFDAIPYPDAVFDGVISIQTLNHGNEEAVLSGIAEIERVLTPNGRIFITVPGRIANGHVRYCLVRTAQQIAPRTFVPTIGNEKGVPHYIYDQAQLRRHYGHFHIDHLWKDSRGYYAILARKKSKG